MLEGLAGWLLKTYIGKYVHLNTDKLSVGLLSGYLELENLPIRIDVFNEYDLPFEIKFGHIGKIKLNISLNKFSKTPWSLAVEGIYLILSIKDTSSAKSLFNLSEKLANKELNLIEKLKALELLESKWLKELELMEETSSLSSTQQSKWFSFASIAYNLLKNIKVNFTNIHLRFEDTEQSFGLRINSIDIRNQENFDESDPQDAFIKLFELNESSVYVDNRKIYSENTTGYEYIVLTMNSLM